MKGAREAWLIWESLSHAVIIFRALAAHSCHLDAGPSCFDSASMMWGCSFNSTESAATWSCIWLGLLSRARYRYSYDFIIQNNFSAEVLDFSIASSTRSKRRTTLNLAQNQRFVIVNIFARTVLFLIFLSTITMKFHNTEVAMCTTRA